MVCPTFCIAGEFVGGKQKTHRASDFKEPEPLGTLNLDRFIWMGKFPGGRTTFWKYMLPWFFFKMRHIFQADIKKYFPEESSPFIGTTPPARISSGVGMYKCCMKQLEVAYLTFWASFASMCVFVAWSNYNSIIQFYKFALVFFSGFAFFVDSLLIFCFFLENVCKALFFLCFYVSWLKRSTNNK